MTSKTDEHIHMLGCQAMAEARNLGYTEAKGEKTDDGELLDMIDKHEKLLAKAIKDEVKAGQREILKDLKKHSTNFYQMVEIDDILAELEEAE